MSYVKSALGHYPILGNPAEGDCIIGSSMGTVTDNESVNRALAYLMLDFAEGRPMIADRNLADAFPSNSPPLAKIAEGPISDIRGGGLGTWGSLQIAKEYMDEHGLERPIQVAHRRHIGRVVRQAAKLGIQSITVPGMPDRFDWESEQLWTKHAVIWVPMDVLGSLRLKRQGKL